MRANTAIYVADRWEARLGIPDGETFLRAGRWGRGDETGARGEDDEGDPEQVRAEEVGHLQPGGREEGYVGDAEEVLQSEEEQDSDGEGRDWRSRADCGAMSQTMKTPAMRLMAGWSQRIWRSQELPEEKSCAMAVRRLCAG